MRAIHWRTVFQKLLAIVFILGALVPCGILPVAAENRTVRVGVYELEGFHSFEQDGTCVGYDVDYLNRIANVTGWNYEYVKANSWSEAMDLLREGKIDLLAPSQMTTDRLAEFSFSAFPIGKVYGAILTLKDNPTIYEDFEAFSQMTFGIEKGNTYAKIFDEYAVENDFTPEIVFYENHTDLVAALRDKQVDAIIANVMRAEKDMRLLGKAGTAMYYYMYRKEDVALGNELNNALDRIEMDEPNFQTEMVTAYFPIYNEEPFSKDELDFVKQLPVIRVACPSKAFPHSFIDSDTGKLTGITIDYLTASGAAAGIQYDFIPFENEQLTTEFLKDYEISLVVESGLSPLEKNRSTGVYSNNILDTQQLIVCSNDLNFSVENNLRIAWYGINNIGSRNMRNSLPNFTWLAVSDMDSCLEAVRNKEADGCMLNVFAAQYYLSKPQYENLVMISNSSVPQSLSLRSGVAYQGFDPSDPMFMTVLNKSFKQISEIEEQQITIHYTTAMPYRLTFSEAVYRYRLPILLAIAMLGMVGAILIGYARNRNYKAQRDLMTGLYNRTSGKQEIIKHLTRVVKPTGAMILMDLDHFKAVNDTLGHQAGDQLLKETAAILKANCRSSDVICRLGGDEFLLYIPYNGSSDFLHEKLEQIRTQLDHDVCVNGKCVRVSCSMGVASVPRDGITFEVLYKRADEALYRVKEKGRNGFEFYSQA